MPPQICIIYGPTCSGKSALALKLAARRPSAIINMDVYQMYTPLTIGTAKPDWQHLSPEHYLFDTIGIPRDCTVMEYRATVAQLIEKLHVDNRLPILVGGSGFYAATLFFPSRTIETEKQKNGAGEGTWDDLALIDPERAAAIPPHDTYRIKRALAIWHATGIKPSACAPIYDPIVSSALLVHVTKPRAQLYADIDARTIHMLKHGWIDEVASLRGTAWEQFVERKGVIGYREILAYLRNEETEYEALVSIIQKKTRNYAKRQETYWRMLARKLGNMAGITLCEAPLTLPHDERYSLSVIHKIEEDLGRGEYTHEPI